MSLTLPPSIWTLRTSATQISRSYEPVANPLPGVISTKISLSKVKNPSTNPVWNTVGSLRHNILIGIVAKNGLDEKLLAFSIYLRVFNFTGALNIVSVLCLS